MARSDLQVLRVRLAPLAHLVRTVRKVLMGHLDRWGRPVLRVFKGAQVCPDLLDRRAPWAQLVPKDLSDLRGLLALLAPTDSQVPKVRQELLVPMVHRDLQAHGALMAQLDFRAYPVPPVSKARQVLRAPPAKPDHRGRKAQQGLRDQQGLPDLQARQVQTAHLALKVPWVQMERLGR